MPEELKIKIDHDLGENEHIAIRTPEGLIMISTFVGTGVLVYDDEESNPMAQAFIRREKQ